ncbi:MAG: hypothetical protein ACTSYJ_09100 [Candidatus Thorarchaeota archaeon]
MIGSVVAHDGVGMKESVSVGRVYSNKRAIVGALKTVEQSVSRMLIVLQIHVLMNVQLAIITVINRVVLVLIRTYLVSADIKMNVKVRNGVLTSISVLTELVEKRRYSVGVMSTTVGLNVILMMIVLLARMKSVLVQLIVLVVANVRKGISMMNLGIVCGHKSVEMVW